MKKRIWLVIGQVAVALVAASLFGSTALAHNTGTAGASRGKAAGTAGAAVWRGHAGRPSGVRGDRGALLAVVASQTGLSQAAVTTAVAGGQTLAQVATAHGATVEAVVNAFVDAQGKTLATQVSAGRLTQAQADQRLAALRTHATAEMNEAPGARPVQTGHASRKLPGARRSHGATATPTPTP